MLTDKSTIPLSVHDLRAVEGKLRFNDGRLALRLGLARNDWRALIKRHESGAIERGLETLTHGAAKSTGGRPFADWFLTIAQTIYYTARSETKNALDVVAEVALIVEALRTGATVPDTPLTDALFAPDAPTVTRGDDNIVRVEWEQPDLFVPPSKTANERHLDAIAGPPSKPGGFTEAKWIDQEAGVNYSITQSFRSTGATMSFFFERVGTSRVATEAVFWVPEPSGNGGQVGLYLNHVIPLAVVERTVDRLGVGLMSDLTRNTLRHYLAF